MQRFSAITYRAITDQNITDSEYRTLGAIAAHADKDGWCYPSQKKLADLRGVTRQTINTHVKKLTELGYLNIKPRYREDGGQTSNLMQVRLDFPSDDLTGGVKSKTLQGVSSPDLTGGVKPTFDTINTTEETQKINNNDSFVVVIKEYENNIGIITKIVSEKIGYAVGEYPTDWIIEAIEIATLNNVRKWSYVEGVLKNWKANGKGDKTTNPAAAGDYRSLWYQVKAEIAKNGRRSKLQWNGQIAPVLKRAGGYSRLCSLSVYDAEQTFKSAYKDGT
jgi:DnaD/phage-associated family protein